MRLVIVRHAEAGPGTPDELRTLTPAGRDQARELGRRLRDEGLEPDAVLSSPLLPRCAAGPPCFRFEPTILWRAYGSR